MGTGPFAVPAFRALLQSPHDVLALVTRPVSEAGRRKDSANPMRDAAVAAGIPIEAPSDVNAAAFIEWLRARDADLFVVCDFGQILSADCLRAARLGGINLHGSLLPKYRGAAPIQWAVYHGESTTGVSVIHMTPRLDAGPILARIATPVGDDETSEQLEPRLAELGAAAVLQAIETLERWDGDAVIGEPQDGRLATRAPRLRKEQGRIDWTRSAGQIRDQIRAFAPWPGSFTHLPRPGLEPLRLILHVAQVDSQTAKHLPGTILSVDQDRMIVACGDGSLALLEIQPAGKRRMKIDEFLRGHPLQLGMRLDDD
jgi:methionyl-tRNA formyltransferase